ncbi:YL1-domain-containing protein [Trichocladium antarcticum]|uniref:YL1-domain-containing protein n=1 Tax=Trichocladium antarcticum TaxID=1450529 RepID=A0AAN6USX0_9PEZI|nr:YL1-domain-containing protein [Trichocladium antarcticum]
MASDDDERKTSSPDELSDRESASSSDGEVEWLATSRSKRSTAGNRMKSMLAKEAPADDSDLELLFAEDEDDAGFSEDANDDGSDVQMDSSSDEEDKENNGDELEGEQELDRQAREKRTAQRKRKAQEAIPAKFRKKVRIEQPARPPRPKKKSERASWLPSPADLPVRASERSTTRMSKQQLHQKMVSDEIRRRKQVERMEKKARLLEASKKPPMSQAERLAEAAIIEKRNFKSLNRWEVAEKQREEERLRKIAALSNRKLDGPVVTFWSGIQQLKEGQAKHVGNLVSIEEKAPRKKRQSVAAGLATGAEAATPTAPAEMPGAKAVGEPPALKSENPDASALSSTPPVPTPDTPAGPLTQGAPTAPLSAPVAPPTPATAPTTAPTPMAPPPIPPPPDTKPGGLGMLVAPVLAPPAAPMPGFSGPSMKSNILAAPNTTHTPSALSMPSSAPAVTASTPTPTIPAAALPIGPVTPVQPTPIQPQPPAAKPPDTPQEAPPAAAEPGREEKVTKSCIILQNFNESAIKDRQVQTQILFGRRMNKLASECPPLPIRKSSEC